MSSFVGAIAIADLVKTTLGPKGMDKILQSVSGDCTSERHFTTQYSTSHKRHSFLFVINLQVGDPNNVRITITNDGATILRSVPVENPAAKVLKRPPYSFCCVKFSLSIVSFGLQVLVDIARIQDDTVGDGTTR